MSDERDTEKSPSAPSPGEKPEKQTYTESDGGTRIEPPKPWPKKGSD